MNSRELINNIIDREELIQAVVSNKRKKEQDDYTKVSVRPIEIKGNLMYQFTYIYDKKEIHKNFEPEFAGNELADYIEDDFRQCQLYCVENDFQVLMSKKFKEKIIKQKPSKKMKSISHNRKKKYILEEGVPCGFLEYLGVMNSEGMIKKQKSDKFRQLNRFLEMVRDVIDNIDKDKELTIIDFGCGKSYLTFALYHYLVNILDLKVNIIGLDLKKDVIKYCNKVAEDLKFKGLKFQVGNIGDFDEFEQVDMVVTLHACDIATDMALYKASRWNSKIILSVPCCQHELYSQVQNKELTTMLKHGIIKERFASLATDSARVNLLEAIGYSTQIIEFIETEHTPKNLLIRAVKTGDKNEAALKEYAEFKKMLQIEPYFEKLLKEKNML